jgi:hypothetical protein
MIDHLGLGGLLDIGLESNGFTCGRFLRYVKDTYFMSPYLSNKLNSFHLVKILLLEYRVDDVILWLWKEHKNLTIDHPLVKIGNIKRIKFLHNEIQARKYVITTLIEKHIKFIIFSSKQMILLFMNFRRALIKLNQLKPHIMSKINIINPSKNIIANAFDNCISNLSIPLLLLGCENSDVASFSGISHIRT